MAKELTWSEQKQWLESHFSNVETKWDGPQRFRSTLLDSEISNGFTRGGVTGRGTTGEESITDLFLAVVHHGQGHHIVTDNYTKPNERVTVNPDTLEITALQNDR